MVPNSGDSTCRRLSEKKPVLAKAISLKAWLPTVAFLRKALQLLNTHKTIVKNILSRPYLPQDIEKLQLHAATRCAWCRAPALSLLCLRSAKHAERFPLKDGGTGLGKARAAILPCQRRRDHLLMHVCPLLEVATKGFGRRA